MLATNCHRDSRQRKNDGPGNSNLSAGFAELAAATGIVLLTEDQNRALQKPREFDAKVSSWLKTSADTRKLGGALFSDRRFGHVFVYHNGARSYDAVRRFCASVTVLPDMLNQHDLEKF